METSTVLIFVAGAAMGAFTAFANGFLRKAGEDSYAWLKSKRTKRPALPSAPMPLAGVKVYPASDFAPPASPVTLAEPATAPALPSVINPPRLDLTFDKIAAGIHSLPLAQQHDAGKAYEGIVVEWLAVLSSIRLEGNTARLGLCSFRDGTESPYMTSTIKCDVSLSEFPELKVLKAGAIVRVRGAIERADTVDVTLQNVHIEFNA